MSFHAQTLQTSYFAHDGRGPTLNRWLQESELYLPDSSVGFAPFVGDIVGAQYTLPVPSDATPDGSAWMIFHDLQVMQIVPEEVHSYWHRAPWSDSNQHTGAWEIEHSPWIMAFNPRHLADKKHFILEFYDEIVEVFCTELIFGAGQFTIEAVVHDDPRFARAYLRYAEAQEKRGDLIATRHALQKYIAAAHEQSARAYAHRWLERLNRM